VGNPFHAIVAGVAIQMGDGRKERRFWKKRRSMLRERKVDKVPYVGWGITKKRGPSRKRQLGLNSARTKEKKGGYRNLIEELTEGLSYPGKRECRCIIYFRGGEKKEGSAASFQRGFAKHQVRSLKTGSNEGVTWVPPLSRKM